MFTTELPTTGPRKLVQMLLLERRIIQFLDSFGIIPIFMPACGGVSDKRVFDGTLGRVPVKELASKRQEEGLLLMTMSLGLAQTKVQPLRGGVPPEGSGPGDRLRKDW